MIVARTETARIIVGIAILGVFALAACSDGSRMVPHSSTSVLSDAKSAVMSLTLVVPSQLTSAHERAAKYVSASTASLSIVVTPPSGSALPATVVACTSTCAATLSVPVGVDTVELQLTDGAAHELSRVSIPLTIVSGIVNSFHLTANPVVDHVAVMPAMLSTPGGSIADIPVTLNAYDIDNNLIVGPGNYVDEHGPSHYVIACCDQ